MPPRKLNERFHKYIRRSQHTRALVGAGTTQITWLVDDAESCTVTGNGSTWTGTSGSRTSNPITELVRYTIACDDTDADTTQDDFTDSALLHLSQLPGLGFAFASKVCAFLAPDRCGVADSVIARANREFNFLLGGDGFISKTRKNATAYDVYCVFLTERAEFLNSQGEGLWWTDRDGARCRWRAIDIERALYAPAV